MIFNNSQAFQPISITISIIECKIARIQKSEKSIVSMRTAFSGTSVTPDFTKIACWRTSVAYSMWLVDLASFPPGFRVILFSGRGQLTGKEKSTNLYGGRWVSGSFSGSLRSFGISFGGNTDKYNIKVHANFQVDPLAGLRENLATRPPPWWSNWWFSWNLHFWTSHHQ